MSGMPIIAIIIILHTICSGNSNYMHYHEPFALVILITCMIVNHLLWYGYTYQNKARM